VRVDMSLSYTQIYETRCIIPLLSAIKKQNRSFAVHYPSQEGLLQATCLPAGRCGHNNFPADSEFATSLPAHTNINKPFNAI
jgi:hypothetical protein